MEVALAYRHLQPVAAVFAWEGPTLWQLVYLGIVAWTFTAWSCGCCFGVTCTRARGSPRAPALPPTPAAIPGSNLPVPLLSAHVAAEAKLGEKRRHAQGSRGAAASPCRDRRETHQELSASSFLPYGSRSGRIEAPPQGSW